MAAVPILVGGTATLFVMVATRRSTRGSEADEEIKMPSEMSVGERLLARVRGRGQGNTARPEPTVNRPTAARLARDANRSMSSGRPVGASYGFTSGLVFPGDEAAVKAAQIVGDREGAAEAAALAAAVEAALNDEDPQDEESEAAARQAQQRRMLLYPFMLLYDRKHPDL